MASPGVLQDIVDKARARADAIADGFISVGLPPPSAMSGIEGTRPEHWPYATRMVQYAAWYAFQKRLDERVQQNAVAVSTQAPGNDFSPRTPSDAPTE